MEDSLVIVLARRQYEVARLASKGLTNKEIASSLGVSDHTVRNTLRVIFDKAHVSNRTELAGAFVGRRIQCDHADART